MYFSTLIPGEDLLPRRAPQHPPTTGSDPRGQTPRTHRPGLWHHRAAYLADSVVMMPRHTFLCLTQGRIFSPLLNAGYHMGSF